MSGLAVTALIIMAAVSAWGFTLARACAQHSRLRAEMARMQEEMREEIQRWREEAARARIRAAQLERDAETWAAGCKQGRDDVIAVVPMLIAAHEGGGGTCSQHGAQEVSDPA
jgi:septal ring factor EnvC (AmiA/AmiB activator)